MIRRATFVASLVLTAGLVGGSGPAVASVEGSWRAPTDNAEIRIETCGGTVCGRLVTSDRLKALPDQRDAHNHDRALRSRTLKGVMIVQGFSGGPAQWTGGTVYDPAGGGTYKGRLTLIGSDTLKMTGCIVAPLCRSQTWTRIK